MAVSNALALTLIGAPVELGAGTLGCQMGPAALRTARLPEMLAELGHDVRDGGDVAPQGMQSSGLAAQAAARSRNADAIASWTRAIHDATYEALSSGRLPIAMGGDHSLSMGSLSAVARHCAQKGVPLAVLWIDAHADFNTPETTPSGNLHGMSVAMACGARSLRPLLGDRPFAEVDPSLVTLFGLRSIDVQERAAVLAAGMRVEDMRRIDEFGAGAVMREILRDLAARGAHLHVSFDVDALDPSLAPGVGTTVPGGLTYREAHLAMEMLSDSGLVGSADLVELNPFLDERGKSAIAMAELTASLFGRTVIDR